MKKLTVLLAMLSLLSVSGCYRPSWYRADTTYAQLKTDSNWCKGQTNIGSTRAEMIERYERCMRDKGYELKDKNDSYGGEPIIKAEGDTGPIVIDKNTKVYIGFSLGYVTSSYPQFKYFHKKDCKYLSNVSIEEMTVGEAIARGKSPCPYCFRD